MKTTGNGESGWCVNTEYIDTHLQIFHFASAGMHTHTHTRPIKCQYELIRGYEADVYAASVYSQSGRWVLMDLSFIEVTIKATEFLYELFHRLMEIPLAPSSFYRLLHSVFAP